MIERYDREGSKQEKDIILHGPRRRISWRVKAWIRNVKLYTLVTRTIFRVLPLIGESGQSLHGGAPQASL
jgi:hypothetical protein